MAKQRRTVQEPTLPGWDEPEADQAKQSVEPAVPMAMSPPVSQARMPVPHDTLIQEIVEQNIASPLAAQQFPQFVPNPTPPGDVLEQATGQLLVASELGTPADALEKVSREGFPDLRGKTVWGIDSMSLIFQVFHAVPEMTSPQGLPVNAVFGFTRDLFAILEQKRPDYLFCAYDLDGPTFRHELYAPYKQNRSDMPPDLIPQIAMIRRVLETLEIPILELAGYEADDLLATLARRVEAAGGECVLVTADKDYRQLITDRVRLYSMRKNQYFDAAMLLTEWGVAPGQVIDYQVLVGDAVDNIPGVPLIGPKIATELLQKYGTLENIFANAHALTGEKRKQNLLAARDQTVLARQLVRLETDVNIEIPWAAAACRGFCPQSAQELFAELGFHALTNKMRGEQLRQAPVKLEATYQTIDTPEKLAWLAAELGQVAQFSLDTETTHIHPRWAEIVGISCAWQQGEAYYIPIRAPERDQCLDLQLVLDVLRPILENPAIGKIGQNLKYDLIVLRSAGVETRGVVFDTMVASYLLDAGERNHNLDELASRYLNHKTTTIAELIGTGKAQKRMDEVPVEQITHYAAEDADIPLRLEPLLTAKLAQRQLTDLNQRVEVPLIDVLADLEYQGIRVDAAQLRDLSGKYEIVLERLEAEIHALAGRSFNIASPKQLQEVLFTEQKLPVLKRTKTGPSTDVEVLEELALQHPLPAKIIEYRQISKLKNTYIDALPELIHPATGRVHASFHQAVAATGRLSSSDPNLQNIPIRTESGREIRAAFLPGNPDWRLVAADYSQIELRVLAHYSGDETMCQAFQNDEDIHARVASQVFHVPLDQVTSAQRRVAKAVNFGIIYGQSPFGLAKALGIEQTAAAEFIDAYFRGYPGVAAFMEQVLADCARQGYVGTILGRRRAITGVKPPNPAHAALPPSASQRQKSLPERTAINTVIQGSAADLIKLAMLAIHRRLSSENWQTKMLLQIHDELVFEAPPTEIDAISELIEQEMTGVMQLKVPLKVDLKAGRTWAECE
ncbi:MAG: DNA polymerase I [Pirellulales bacterium]|nr:DNA polymerase I [Pirellulales bacterium]